MAGRWNCHSRLGAGDRMAAVGAVGRLLLRARLREPRGTRARLRRSVTGYTQETTTWPGPHGCPCWHSSGQVHQSGRHTSIARLEHVSGRVLQCRSGNVAGRTAGLPPGSVSMLRRMGASLYSLFATTRDILRRYGPDVAEPRPEGSHPASFALRAARRVLASPQSTSAGRHACPGRGPARQ
jgi:hypothetical protein